MALSNSTGLENSAFLADTVLSKVLLALVIMLIGFIAGRVLGLLARRFLSEVSFDRRVRRVGVKFSVERLIGAGISFLIYATTIFLSINTLGLTSTLVTIILFGIVFVIIVSFLLAIKDFFPNMLSGLRLYFSELFVDGDEIQIQEVKGIVIHLGLLETRIMNDFNEQIIIPNALFTKRKILVRPQGKVKKDKARK